MSGIGFLIGYFVMYSIRSGSKTQDVFKSFLGAGGLAGGAFLFPTLKDTTLLSSLESSVLWGAGVYTVVAIVLVVGYAWAKSDPIGKTQTGFLLMGRILIGEDFSTPPSK